MDPKYKRLLKSCDEKGAYEFPAKFNYESLEQNALTVEKELQTQMGLQTKFEGAIFNQDASFSIAILLLDYTSKKADVIYQPVIRFSNFGKLVSLTMLDKIPANVVDEIRTILDKNEFHFIPQDILDTQYDGVMVGNKDFPTWWIRYFEYI